MPSRSGSPSSRSRTPSPAARRRQAVITAVALAVIGAVFVVTWLINHRGDDASSASKAATSTSAASTSATVAAEKDSATSSSKTSGSRRPSARPRSTRASSQPAESIPAALRKATELSTERYELLHTNARHARALLEMAGPGDDRVHLEFIAASTAAMAEGCDDLQLIQP